MDVFFLIFIVAFVSRVQLPCREGENTSWTLSNKTLRTGIQLQYSSESHSLRATIECQKRTTNSRHVGLSIKCRDRNDAVKNLSKLKVRRKLFIEIEEAA